MIALRLEQELRNSSGITVIFESGERSSSWREKLLRKKPFPMVDILRKDDKSIHSSLF